MDSFALLSKFFPVAAGRNPHEVLSRRRPALFPSPSPSLPARRSRRVGSRGAGFVTFAAASGRNVRASSSVGKEVVTKQLFASVSSSGNNQMTTGSAVASVAVPSSSSSIGSPLFWVGIGVGLYVVANRLKTYALQQAFETMMNQAASQGGQFNSPFVGSSPPFPFPATITPPQNPAWTPPRQVSPQQPVTVDAAPTKVESTSSSEVQDETQNKVSQLKKFAFVDVSPELLQNERSFMSDTPKASPVDTQSAKEIQMNGTVKQNASSSTEQPKHRQSASPLSVDALEKMMEDPTVQKMVYPNLPEEMMNPESFKWMMQNPQFRQQMQDMLTTLVEIMNGTITRQIP